VDEKPCRIRGLIFSRNFHQKVPLTRSVEAFVVFRLPPA
jgi:hypothetical protein